MINLVFISFSKVQVTAAWLAQLVERQLGVLEVEGLT